MFGTANVDAAHTKRKAATNAANVVSRTNIPMFCEEWRVWTQESGVHQLERAAMILMK